jgi:hypothetical protein
VQSEVWWRGTESLHNGARRRRKVEFAFWSKSHHAMSNEDPKSSLCYHSKAYTHQLLTEAMSEGEGGGRAEEEREVILDVHHTGALLLRAPPNRMRVLLLLKVSLRPDLLEIHVFLFLVQRMFSHVRQSKKD